MTAAYDAFYATISKLLEDIWDQGYTAGWNDAVRLDGGRIDGVDTPSPYRTPYKAATTSEAEA